MGSNADDIRNLLGDYSYAAHIQLLVNFKGQGLSDTPLPADMSDTNIFVPMQSVLAAMRAQVFGSTALHYAQGCTVLGRHELTAPPAAIAAAQQAEVAIVVVGDKAGLTKKYSTGEFRGPRRPNATRRTRELVKAIVATGTPTVVVYTNGRPVSSPSDCRTCARHS